MRDYLSLSALNIVFRILMILLLLSGLQAASSTENTLNISIGSMGGLGTDPTLCKSLWPDTGGFENYHYYTHFSPLVDRDTEGNIIPWMAESFEVSDDSKTITFRLREGIKFADGTPLNASILKFNFDRVITHGCTDKRDKHKLPTYLYYDYSEATDENTFKIHFSKGWLNVVRDLPQTWAYSAFINPQDLNPEWDIKGTLRPEKRYNGLGPYYVDENESILNEKVVLKRRNSWRDDLSFHEPKVDKIVLKYINEPEVAVKALEKGEIDYICRYWNPSLSSIVQLENNPMISIKTRPNARTFFLVTAYWKEPFNGSDGILLRKAMCYGLDRKEIVRGAFHGYATEAVETMYFAPQLPEVPACCHQGYDYNPEMAKKLLAQAGWSDSDGDGLLDKCGKPLKSLDLIISSSSTQELMKDLSLQVKSQLKNMGIDVNVRSLDSGDYKDSWNKGEYDLLLSYNNPIGYPMAQQLMVFNSSLGYGISKGQYCDDSGKLAEFVHRSWIAQNRVERDQYVCEACDILYQEAGLIPLVHQMEYALMRNSVNGFEFGSGWGEYDHVDECVMQ